MPSDYIASGGKEMFCGIIRCNAPCADQILQCRNLFYGGGRPLYELGCLYFRFGLSEIKRSNAAATRVPGPLIFRTEPVHFTRGLVGATPCVECYRKLKQLLRVRV